MTEPESSKDRITEIRIQGMRALADVRLPLGGLTVLIGENGSGKSTILEALELLRRAALPGRFVVDQLIPFHGGLDALLRAGEKTLLFSVTIEGGGDPIEYTFALGKSQWSSTIVSEERLRRWERPGGAEPQALIVRDANTCQLFDPAVNNLVSVASEESRLALSDPRLGGGLAAESPRARVLSALDAIRVHVPFDVRAGWVVAQPAAMRLPAHLGVADDLDRLGANLANCYHKLSNDSSPEIWERILERVRAGLGEDVITVRTPAVGPSLIDLQVVFRGLPQPIPALALSDGQLAYLAFVAVTELGKHHGLVAFDEPEQHLHPGLLVRVVWLLEELAESCQVIVATQSDRLLDALTEPEKSVVLCELDETRATRLFKPDPEVRQKWLKRYRGFGELRAEGLAPHVFSEPMGTAK